MHVVFSITFELLGGKSHGDVVEIDRIDLLNPVTVFARFIVHRRTMT